MALLNRLMSRGHLDERALAAAWADGRVEGTPPAHPHLAACPACRARLAELSAWLEDVRVDASAEADAAFPAERLAAQHAYIVRRLEAAGRPARVIAFPKLAGPIASSTSPVRRWVASAAAAGLIAGIGLGNYMDLRHTLLRPSVAVTPDPVLLGSNGTISDEELMWHLEQLGASSIPEELTAFDSLTPRARDYPR